MDNNHNQRNYARQSDVAIQLMSESVTQLKADFGDMRHDLKEVLKEFSDSVSKLVVMDEKLIHTNINIERILKIAERSHERIDKLNDDCSTKHKQLQDTLDTKHKEMQESVDSKHKDLETRLDQLEKDAPMQKQTSAWILSAVYGAAGMLVMFVAKSLGII